jgi:hypothetical protein
MMEVELFMGVQIQKLISGGQTGADRAALDWAIENGIEHGGWCPCGRLAEDGPIASRYKLTETQSGDYAERTEWNVRDSDGTVIFSIAAVLTGGSAATQFFARKLGKPVIHISQETPKPAEALRRFIRRHKIRMLNVAGPRHSTEPEIGEFVKSVLDALE